MKTPALSPAPPSGRLRTLLDCLLVLILLLGVSAQEGRVQAGQRLPPGQPLPAGAGPAVTSLFISPAGVDMGLPGGVLPAVRSPVDDITLAATIAAENAALTLPQYSIGLPLLTR